MSRLAPLLLGIALLPAGCLQSLRPDAAPAGPAWTPPPVPDFDFTKALVATHDHHDREAHSGSFGLELVGFSDLTDKLADWSFHGGYLQLDVRGSLVSVATFEGNRAFTLVDVADPSNPRVLSHFYSWGENWNARISDDGKWVFVGCQGGTPFGAFTQLANAGACVSPDGTAPEGGSTVNGIMSVDVSDPESPRLAGWTPSRSVHELFTATMDDGTILVGNNRIDLFEWDPGAREFLPLSTPEGMHDLAIAKHPITGEMLIYTGTQDLTIYNITDPAEPTVAGAYDRGDKGVSAWHEQTPAPALLAGRHITVGGGETSQGVPTPVGVYDTTDPANISLLGEWLLPGGPYPAQGSYKFSVHNIDVSRTGQACIAHYHGGVWVIDVSTPERMAKPVTLAYYQPNGPPAGPPLVTPYGTFAEAPNVWGCMWDDRGYLIVPDMMTGLYVLRPTWPGAMPAGPT